MSKTEPASVAQHPHQRKLVVMATDVLLTQTSVDTLLKLPNISIVVVTDKPPTHENLFALNERFKTMKGFQEVRCSFPRKLPDFAMFEFDQYEQGRSYARQNPTVSKVFVIYDAVGTHESEENFICCSWSFVSQYFREYLGIKERKKGKK